MGRQSVEDLAGRGDERGRERRRIVGQASCFDSVEVDGLKMIMIMIMMRMIKVIIVIMMLMIRQAMPGKLLRQRLGGSFRWMG